MEITKENAGASLYDYRVENGMTQATLAKLVKIERVTISRLERGVSKPSVMTLHRLKKYLDSPFDKTPSPLKNLEGFKKAIPDSIFEKYPRELVYSELANLVNYCKSKHKTYKDYNAALRTFLKKHPQKTQSNRYAEL